MLVRAVDEILGTHRSCHTVPCVLRTASFLAPALSRSRGRGRSYACAVIEGKGKPGDWSGFPLPNFSQSVLRNPPGPLSSDSV